LQFFLGLFVAAVVLVTRKNPLVEEGKRSSSSHKELRERIQTSPDFKGIKTIWLIASCITKMIQTSLDLNGIKTIVGANNYSPLHLFLFQRD